ncbi:MAG: YraN family protein [Planctomycetota bacterium]
MWFARTLRPCAAEVGEAGERIAASYLRASGMQFLGRRVATQRAEVDLVFLDRGRLVCVEVKTALRARSGLWRPGDSWRSAAFQRQRSAAAELQARKLASVGGPPRLDLVEVWIGPHGKRPEICHRPGLERLPSRSP